MSESPYGIEGEYKTVGAIVESCRETHSESDTRRYFIIEYMNNGYWVGWVRRRDTLNIKKTAYISVLYLPDQQ